MTDAVATGPEPAPPVEVRVFRFGRLVDDEVCPSDDEALEVINRWVELVGVELEVHHLTG